eukprot:2700047-Amphidinium_carterae.3
MALWSGVREAHESNGQGDEQSLGQRKVFTDANIKSMTEEVLRIIDSRRVTSERPGSDGSVDLKARFVARRFSHFSEDPDLMSAATLTHVIEIATEQLLNITTQKKLRITVTVSQTFKPPNEFYSAPEDQSEFIELHADCRAVAQSSAEAEHYALTSAANDLIHLQPVIMELGAIESPQGIERHIHADSGMSETSKHMELRYLQLQSVVEKHSTGIAARIKLKVSAINSSSSTPDLDVLAPKSKKKHQDDSAQETTIVTIRSSLVAVPEE